jgi:hypothetical protein
MTNNIHEHHHTEVRHPAKGYQAYCTTRECGWEAPWVRLTRQEAVDDGCDHEVAVTT